MKFLPMKDKTKRIRPRAQGRAFKILKPTCHITVVMKENN
jgi:large subunit ribosomal protein L22